MGFRDSEAKALRVPYCIWSRREQIRTLTSDFIRAAAILIRQSRSCKSLKYHELTRNFKQTGGRVGFGNSESEFDFFEPQEYVNHGPPPRRMVGGDPGGTRASSCPTGTMPLVTISSTPCANQCPPFVYVRRFVQGGLAPSASVDAMISCDETSSALAVGFPTGGRVCS